MSNLPVSFLDTRAPSGNAVVVVVVLVPVAPAPTVAAIAGTTYSTVVTGFVLLSAIVILSFSSQYVSSVTTNREIPFARRLASLGGARVKSTSKYGDMLTSIK